MWNQSINRCLSLLSCLVLSSLSSLAFDSFLLVSFFSSFMSTIRRYWESAQRGRDHQELARMSGSPQSKSNQIKQSVWYGMGKGCDGMVWYGTGWYSNAAEYDQVRFNPRVFRWSWVSPYRTNHPLSAHHTPSALCTLLNSTHPLRHNTIPVNAEVKDLASTSRSPGCDSPPPALAFQYGESGQLYRGSLGSLVWNEWMDLAFDNLGCNCMG